MPRRVIVRTFGIVYSAAPTRTATMQDGVGARTNLKYDSKTKTYQVNTKDGRDVVLSSAELNTLVVWFRVAPIPIAEAARKARENSGVFVAL